MTSWKIEDRRGQRMFIAPTGEAIWLRGVWGVSWDLSRPDIYKAKYGGDGWEKRWAEAAVRRLKGWGFNCVGPYSRMNTWHGDPAKFLYYQPEPIPYTFIVKPGFYVLQAAGGSVPDLIAGADPNVDIGYRGGVLADPFHPTFASEVERVIQKHEELSYADLANPWQLGIVADDLDNLSGFGPAPPHPKAHAHVADIVRANPKSAAFKELQYVAKYGGNDDAFLYSFAFKTFDVVASVLRKLVPAAIVISPNLNSWGGLTRAPILKAAADVFDVVQVSFATEKVLTDTLAITKDATLLAYLTGVANPDSAINFAPNAAASDVPDWPARFATQGERGAYYRAQVELVQRYPQIAGLLWWEWTDKPTEGRNDGLLTLDDRAYDGTEAPYGDMLLEVEAGNMEAATARLEDALPSVLPTPAPTPPEPPGGPTGAQVMDFELQVGDSLKLTGSLTLTPRKP